MMKLLHLYLISLSTAIRIQQVKNAKVDVPKFTIGVISFPQQKMQNATNFAKVDSTAALWQTRKEHFYDVSFSAEKPTVELIGPIESQGGPLPTAKILKELIKDLPSDTVAKLKTCSAHAKAVGHVDKAIEKMQTMKHSPGVWIIMTGETGTGKELAKYAPDKAVIIGNGYDSTELDKYNIDGKSIHNLWLPYALWWYAESNTHTPMELMSRDNAEAKVSQKSSSVVYQQFKCYPEREKFWDDLCEGMSKIDQKCYAMSKCNGNKNLGVPAPFASAGSRQDKNWQDNAISNYEHFKFVSALEHTQNEFGYTTEKLFLPLLAGSIPIYTGDQHALDKLGVNRKSYVYVTPETHKEAIEEVQMLLKDEAQYKARVALPIIDEAKFREYFTWHSSTWEKYGDQTRDKVIKAVLDVCGQ